MKPKFAKFAHPGPPPSKTGKLNSLLTKKISEKRKNLEGLKPVLENEGDRIHIKRIDNGVLLCISGEESTDYKEKEIFFKDEIAAMRYMKENKKK